MPRKKGSNQTPANQNVSKEKASTPQVRNFSRLSGFKDIIPSNCKYWYAVINKAIEFCKYYTFREIKTPILENYELFETFGERGKENKLFNFLDEKKEKIALRPELTQGIMRAYTEHTLSTLPSPVRLFSIGPVFRKEKIQNSHSRQFYQMNLEVIGQDKPVAESILIAMFYNFFKELDLPVQVQINSLGSREAQKTYSNKLAAYYKQRGKKSKLCENCQKNLTKEPLSLLDCKNEECQNLKEEAPQVTDYLSEESKEHFTKVLEYLDELEINYNFNPYLVRNLRYYSETVFEFWPLGEKDEPQAKWSLGGGGRYDDLLEKMGEKPTPAVGMALGLDRIVTKVKDKDLQIFKNPDNIVFLAQLSDSAKIKSFSLFQDLRESGYDIRQSFATNSLKSQLEEAKELDARITLILGKKELMEETIILRDMDSGVQETVSQKKVKQLLKKYIK